MRRSLLRLSLVVALTVQAASALAECLYPDGTPAPEPGLSQAAMNDTAWGPRLVVLFNNLSDGDKSVLVAMLKGPEAALLTLRCSANDLFWTHLSLVGLSEEVPGPETDPSAKTSRDFKLTEQGRSLLPVLLQAPQFQWPRGN